MRLRGDTPDARRRKWAREYRVLSKNLSAERGYWRTLRDNVLSRVGALIVRGLRVRASKVRVWKDGADWEFSGDTLVVSGCAEGMFGSKYTVSLNEVSFRSKIPASGAPVQIESTRGVEITARLSARFLGLLRARRMSLIDDLRVTVEAHQLSFEAASSALRATLKKAEIDFSPRHSRSLRARLPASLANPDRSSARGLIRSWEAKAKLRTASLRIAPPPRPPPPLDISAKKARHPNYGSVEWAAGAIRKEPSQYANWLYSTTRGDAARVTGAFFRINHLRVEAYGVTQNDRGDPVVHANIQMGGCCAGSFSVDQLSHELFESRVTNGASSTDGIGNRSNSTPTSKGSLRPSPKRLGLRSRRRRRREEAEAKNEAERELEREAERVEEERTRNAMIQRHMEEIVDARPEAMVWIDDINAAMDANLTRSNAVKLEVAATGIVTALEPVGLASLIADLIVFVSTQFPRKRRALSSPDLPLQEGPPVRAVSSSSLASDGVASVIRSASSSSMGSMEGEPRLLQLVIELRHCRSILLGHGPVGDGDTIALIASADSLSIPSMDRITNGGVKFCAEASNLKLLHWSQWTRTTNVSCKSVRLETNNAMPSLDSEKVVTINTLDVDWDLDAQGAFSAMPHMLKILKHSFKREQSVDMQDGFEGGMDSGPISSGPSTFRDRGDRQFGTERTLSKEEQVHRDKVIRLSQKIAGWSIAGEKVSMSVSFPDGPSMGISVGTLPQCELGAKRYFGRDVVLTLFGTPTVYAETFQLRNPLFTLGRSVQRPNIDIEGSGFRATLGHDVEFGSLIQDWLIRFRAVIKLVREERYMRDGRQAPPRHRIPTPDIFFRGSDIAVYYEDHPLAAFHCNMLPLYQDESRQRMERHALMDARLDEMSSVENKENVSCRMQCHDRLKELDSKIWLERVRKLKEVSQPFEPAKGFLPPLNGGPMSTITADTLDFQMVMDDETHRIGSKESVRKLRAMDSYKFGPRLRRMERQYETDAYNSLGFRDIGFDATNMVLTLRDFPEPFMEMDHVYLDKTVVGQAAQASVAPYVSETKVALGRRRIARITKGLANTKTYADIHLVTDTLTCRFNPSHLGAISDFGRASSRFSSFGKNPSPRIPWFDTLRVSSHGRFRITAKVLQGHLASSDSPYTKTNHYTDVRAENVIMIASRFKATEKEPFPISWELSNWHIRPAKFSNDLQSDINFEYVRVGLDPVPECNSGDPQDHYFVPFPTKEEVRQGGPGIGRGEMEMITVAEPVVAQMNPLGCYTEWTTGLHKVPGFDSYVDFKTRQMTLGIDICIRHPKSIQPGMGVKYGGSSMDIYRDHRLHYDPKGVANGLTPRYWAPEGASVMHSDALTTMIKVVKKILYRPISCRLPSRMIDHARKPPSLTGLSSSLVALNVTMNVSDVNIMLYNNLNPGHGVFLSMSTFAGELRKKTKITFDAEENYERDSRVVHRRVEVRNINTSIRMPELDLAGDETGSGRLFSVARVFVSDDIKDESQYAASPRLKAPYRVSSTGFGCSDHDRSPFYTFSASHALQRGKPLDKVKHDVRIAVDDVRLVWSPARRTSIWAWPDALKEKSFTISAMTESLRPEKQAEDAVEEGADSQKSGSSKNIFDSKTFTADDEAEPAIRTLDSADSDIDVTAYSVPKRSASIAMRRPAGDMKDILKSDSHLNGGGPQMKKKTMAVVSLSENTTVGTVPKFEFLVNSCQICIGSPETAGLVLVTSAAARIGILDKTIKQTQHGMKIDEWVDREHRVHLKEANVFCQTDVEKFDFGADTWVPKDAHNMKPKEIAPLFLVTTKSVSMDLMYISSTTLCDGKKEGRKEDYSLRPSLLFINLCEIGMASTSVEFKAVMDVVRHVLLQRVASSGTVKDKLAQLRYNLQLQNADISTKALDHMMCELSTVTKQFLYAADTSQQSLVEGLLVPEKSFSESLQDYKARLKAVATFIRTDQRARNADFQYPTMYISYSFDKCSWELRETNETTGVTAPIVEISLCDLVCRHIFYVGRGSSAEITFKSIKANNKMHKSVFDEFLKPGGKIGDLSGGKARSIKAADGSPVAFRWFSTQMDKVGGITVYDLLTIQLAPLNAAVSRRLYSAVHRFIFRKGEGDPSGESKSGQSSGRSSRDGPRPPTESTDSIRTHISSQEKLAETEVSQMARRGESTMFFKYVFIDAFELTASYKNKERDRSVLDFTNLFVTTPSFSYSSEVWTWKDFSNRLRKDLVYTFARRGVSNLAKIKLLPGYNRARRKLFEGADAVTKTITNRMHGSPEPEQLPGASYDSDEDSDGSTGEQEDIMNLNSAAGGSPDEERQKVLKALYGPRAVQDSVPIVQAQARAKDSSDPRVVSYAADRNAAAPAAPSSAPPPSLLRSNTAGVHRTTSRGTTSSRGTSSHSLGQPRDSSSSSERSSKTTGLWDRLRRR